MCNKLNKVYHTNKQYINKQTNKQCQLLKFSSKYVSLAQINLLSVLYNFKWVLKNLNMISLRINWTYWKTNITVHLNENNFIKQTNITAESITEQVLSKRTVIQICTHITFP